jgi:hypothetical protein
MLFPLSNDGYDAAAARIGLSLRSGEKAVDNLRVPHEHTAILLVPATTKAAGRALQHKQLSLRVSN